MSNDTPLVYVVDDDVSVRDSIRLLLESIGLSAEVFDSAAAFLEVCDARRNYCLISDMRMPGMRPLADLVQAVGKISLFD